MYSINRRLNFNYIKFIIPAYNVKIYLRRDILFLPEDFKLRLNIGGQWCSPFFPYIFSLENGRINLKILNNSF